MKNATSKSDNDDEKQHSSFFKSSCPSAGSVDRIVPSFGHEENCSRTGKEGWTTSLQFFSGLSTSIIDRRLLKNTRELTMGDIMPTNRCNRNKKLGYRLWKEGYAQNISVKPNVRENEKEALKFLAKSRVHASMKGRFYTVYVHLDQRNGEILHATCNCKAGQGGCCKHAAALLFTLLDYTQMDLKAIPSSLTCTRKAQKWHIPSNASSMLKEAVRFNDILFEKSEHGRIRKKPIVGRQKEGYCATPPFSLELQKEDLKLMSDNLRKAGKASLFCDTLESNNYEPCKMFETSNSKKFKTMDQSNKTPGDVKGIEAEVIDIISSIFANMSWHGGQVNDQILQVVGLTPDRANEICFLSIDQSMCDIWYKERSKRITASNFGKALN